MPTHHTQSRGSHPASKYNKNYNGSAESEEIALLKNKYSSELPTLRELFPTWSEEDILFTLQENQGDLMLTIDRISEGKPYCFIFSIDDLFSTPLLKGSDFFVPFLSSSNLHSVSYINLYSLFTLGFATQWDEVKTAKPKKEAPFTTQNTRNQQQQFVQDKTKHKGNI
jgi:hypothetical protein